MDDPPTVQPRLGNSEFASDWHYHCSTAAFKKEICKFVFFINTNHVDSLSCDYDKKYIIKRFFLTSCLDKDVWLFCTTVSIMMQKEVCDDVT